MAEEFIGITCIMSIYAEIARSEAIFFDFIESNIEDCEFDNKFDFIFSINVMEHLKDPYSVLLQMTNSLNPSGNIASYVQITTFLTSHTSVNGFGGGKKCILSGGIESIWFKFGRLRRERFVSFIKFHNPAQTGIILEAKKNLSSS